ncbi:MAG: adenylate/guanylate cyclase domain-containing protein [Chitinophagaceae bacterium]|nr:MAG: adenylate/guanylate cyclase domain-containing protein [Chitinophagaceae bacterium]
MKKRINSVQDYFLPVRAFKNNNRLYRYKMFIMISFVTALYAAVFFPLSYLIHYDVAFVPIYITVVLCVAYPFLMKKGVRLVILVNVYLAGTCGLMVWLMLTTGGLVRCPENPVFLAVLPVIALLCINRKAAVIWLIITLGILCAFGIATIYGYQFPMAMEKKFVPVFETFSFPGLAVLLFVFVVIFDNAKNAALGKLEEQNKLIEIEKEKSETLLLNILPEEISNELKQTGKTSAHSYDMATVMFSDFVNFTSIGEKLTPEELVSAIAEYFETFDRIIERYGIEKIKTVGDAYICAAGLPIPTTDNALIMIQVAFDFLKALDELNEKRNFRRNVVFNIRIGINTGPLVAGVVGIKKFAYDIWGDTVNTAARLQERGETGRINISGSTYDLIKQTYPCTYRGKIAAKNKGQIDMYFVENIPQGVLS